MASTRLLGRSIWADQGASSGSPRGAVCGLLVAMARQAHKDIKTAVRLGDRATEEQVAAKFTAEQFLEECLRELTQPKG